ncbi:MAG TPA: type II secretion system protein [Pseudolabrys sp.]|nr:type II secretion system protein [Pseudolabrys sp.]
MIMIRLRLSLQKRLRQRQDRGDGGFTLVEVIVAIAILASSASAIFKVTSDSIHNTRRADALTDASLLAQSLLARVGKDIPLQAGELSGRTAAQLPWRLRIEPYGDAPDRDQWPVAAYTVTADVAWEAGADTHPIELRTLRLGPKGSAR